VYRKGRSEKLLFKMHGVKVADTPAGS
jgi:hypothetical protein